MEDSSVSRDGNAPLQNNGARVDAAKHSAMDNPASQDGSSPEFEPPVTRSSLSELDVLKIINNAKLRYDINFDPKLHFSPNMEGDRGRRKHERASVFWAVLKGQLVEFSMDRSSFYDKHGTGDDWCLPKFLQAVKDIIQTLVPQRERQFVDEGLNVEFLMQEFHRGIADVEKLALWLSRLLKSHCAPMRDELVDSMYNQLSSGNRDNDVDELVNGMCSLLSLLEAMKLDVANHQIQALRFRLIEETTPFMQEFLTESLRTGKIGIGDAKLWYQAANQMYPDSGATALSAFGEMGIFLERLSRSMLPSAGDMPLPSTFFFDEDRLRPLRSDVLDAINLSVCLRLYEDLERIAHFNTTPAFSNHALEEEPLMPSMSVNLEGNFNNPPLLSRPTSLALSSPGYASSSPQPSPIPPSHIVHDMGESTAKARKLLNSLVALLQQAPRNLYHLDRWRAMAPSMALQIFRFTNLPSDILPAFEEKLTENVCKTTSPIFEEIQELYRTKLVDRLAVRVRHFKSLSSICLSSIATGNPVPSGSRDLNSRRDRHLDAAIRVGQQQGSIDDIAIRIGHVGVVHWRIWASIAYLGTNT